MSFRFPVRGPLSGALPCRKRVQRYNHFPNRQNFFSLFSEVFSATPVHQRVAGRIFFRENRPGHPNPSRNPGIFHPFFRKFGPNPTGKLCTSPQITGFQHSYTIRLFDIPLYFIEYKHLVNKSKAVAEALGDWLCAAPIDQESASPAADPFVQAGEDEMAANDDIFGGKRAEGGRRPFFGCGGRRGNWR